MSLGLAGALFGRSFWCFSFGREHWSNWMGEVQLESTITCPYCGREITETMPTDACVGFYPCKGCGHMLRLKEGDCCVFCSYGTVACPPCSRGGREVGLKAGASRLCGAEETCVLRGERGERGQQQCINAYASILSVAGWALMKGRILEPRGHFDFTFP
jgi:hypothetical protein